MVEAVSLVLHSDEWEFIRAGLLDLVVWHREGRVGEDLELAERQQIIQDNMDLIRAIERANGWSETPDPMSLLS